jgi:hypothetical protein
VPLPCQSRGAASDTEHRSEYLTVTSWLARAIDGYVCTAVPNNADSGAADQCANDHASERSVAARADFERL